MNNIETALTFITPNMGRDDWVNILMAIKSELGDSGYHIANQWSKQGDNYSYSDFKATWKSINIGGGITIATLFKQAKENGFIPNRLEPLPQVSHSERLAKQRQSEIAEQQAIESRIKAVASYWQTLKAKHPPKPCSNHPYLKAKGIKPHGIHYLPHYTDKYTPHHGKEPLILWIMSNDRLAGFQMIYPDGFKRFIAGTVKRGGYYLVTKDKDPQTANTVVLCEGFATCCSVIEHRHREALGYISFDAGNMPHIAVYLRKIHPDKKIIICAANDHATERATGKNPGTEYGKQAARMAQACFEQPTFSGEGSDAYSDWNDYYELKKQRASNESD